MLLLSFCFTYQGFKQNIESSDARVALESNKTERSSEHDVADTLRTVHDSCVEYTRFDKSVCDNDSMHSMNKTVVTVSPARTPSCKVVDAASEAPLNSTALHFKLDSYTLESPSAECPEGCCPETVILTIESFSAMIERISRKSAIPEMVPEPSASFSEGEEKHTGTSNAKDRIRKGGESV